jgi:hypothetical protein
MHPKAKLSLIFGISAWGLTVLFVIFALFLPEIAAILSMFAFVSSIAGIIEGSMAIRKIKKFPEKYTGLLRQDGAFG